MNGYGANFHKKKTASLQIGGGEVSEHYSLCLDNRRSPRFNTDSDRAEIYDGTEWDSLTGNVTAQLVNGDGSTLVFVLDRDSTTAATLVIINGVVQMPTTAYSMSGNTLTFTQAPQISDAVDIRFL